MIKKPSKIETRKKSDEQAEQQHYSSRGGLRPLEKQSHNLFPLMHIKLQDLEEITKN